jgi:hypothetical protein
MPNVKRSYVIVVCQRASLISKGRETLRSRRFVGMSHNGGEEAALRTHWAPSRSRGCQYGCVLLSTPSAHGSCLWLDADLPLCPAALIQEHILNT